MVRNYTGKKIETNKDNRWRESFSFITSLMKRVWGKRREKIVEDVHKWRTQNIQKKSNIAAPFLTTPTFLKNSLFIMQSASN